MKIKANNANSPIWKMFILILCFPNNYSRYTKWLQTYGGYGTMKEPNYSVRSILNFGHQLKVTQYFYFKVYPTNSIEEILADRCPDGRNQMLFTQYSRIM